MKLTICRLDSRAQQRDSMLESLDIEIDIDVDIEFTRLSKQTYPAYVGE